MLLKFILKELVQALMQNRVRDWVWVMSKSADSAKGNVKKRRLRREQWVHLDKYVAKRTTKR